MNSTKISDCEFVSNAIHNNDLVDGLSEYDSEAEYNEVNNGLLPLIIYPQGRPGRPRPLLLLKINLIQLRHQQYFALVLPLHYNYKSCQDSVKLIC